MTLTLAVAALCGWAIPALVDLLLRAQTPTRWKTLLATTLATVAGVAAAVSFTPGEKWQTYVIAVATAFVNTQASHRTLQGLGDPVQRYTARSGLGPRVAGDAGEIGLLLVILILLILVFGGVGFAVHALWWVVVILFVVLLVSLVRGGV